MITAASKARVVSPSELSTQQIEEWQRLCRSQPHLDSPYFRPEFALDVGACRDDVRVVALNHGAFGPAYFAFQQRGSVARPVGGRLSDYQSLIASPEYPASIAEWLAPAGVSRLEFDHLVDPGNLFAPWVSFTDLSPFADLSEGFDAYQRQNSKGSGELKQTLRKRRKLERELGEIEFRMDDRSPEAWEALLQWKSRQYRASRITDVFSYSWVPALLKRLHQRSDPSFCGLLSSLYAGGKLLAVHFGMRSERVLHYWLPTYEASEIASRCSPGRVLLLEMCRAADQFSIAKIDFGRGVSRQKKSAMTGATPVHVGAVDLRPVRRVLRSSWQNAYDWLKRSPLKGPLKLPGRVVYRMREWMEFR